MDDQKRGDDAADHAPAPSDDAKPAPSGSAKQDAPNYEKRVDDGRAEAVENVNSANDE